MIMDLHLVVSGVVLVTDGDYQSIHDHQGIFTFVVWLKIPFDSEEESMIQLWFQTRSRGLCIGVS